MSLNTFQQSLISYAGFTGTTGGAYVPTQLAPGAAKMTLAQTVTIQNLTEQIDIVVPATATEVVITMRNMLVTAGSIGLYLVSAGNSFGADITPANVAVAQQIYFTSNSPNSLGWVGTMHLGPLNSGADTKVEMVAGNLLTPLIGVTILAVGGGQFSQGVISVFYV